MGNTSPTVPCCQLWVAVPVPWFLLQDIPWHKLVWLRFFVMWIQYNRMNCHCWLVVENQLPVGYLFPLCSSSPDLHRHEQFVQKGRGNGHNGNLQASEVVRSPEMAVGAFLCCLLRGIRYICQNFHKDECNLCKVGLSVWCHTHVSCYFLSQLAWKCQFCSPFLLWNCHGLQLLLDGSD